LSSSAEVTHAEVGVVGRLAADARTQPQVAAHQRRYHRPRGRLDLVERASVDDHRPVRMNLVIGRSGVASRHEVAHTANLAAGGPPSPAPAPIRNRWT